jgi:hypothetical protein
MNRAVLTTKHVIEGTSITSIYLDEEGYYQFFGDEDVKEEDAMVVSLEKILELQPNLKPIIRKLSKNHRASLDSLKNEWVINEEL